MKGPIKAQRNTPLSFRFEAQRSVGHLSVESWLDADDVTSQKAALKGGKLPSISSRQRTKRES